MGNHDLFDEVRALRLPLGHYVITASGPMGVRGIRAMQDVDLMVDDDLFEALAARFPDAVEGGKIELSPNVDAFCESAFPPEPDLPSLAEQISNADVIDGLPFVELDTVIKLKTAKGRPKDFDDIELIRTWQQDYGSEGQA